MDSLRTILDTSVVIGDRFGEIDGELTISAITLAELTSEYSSPPIRRRAV
ncbi:MULTISPECIES: hypothetical protein [Nocardiaceae]|uniref:PIN domain-containing protein n=1 Tax=Rhodococcoides corynebacterioides TaxID=53972 RepID=A0ABS2KV53_9NOCA|nr:MULTISPECIES: hypothetical protein [Rhodococcus]MBM7415807.1 hypothetical protein [Rhodococcus corynebacterioides]MBP1118269.1 hypothetical protein [Rhodococcus sp. PvP016]